MGRRTMSLGLALRCALFLDSDAYNQMRDDDNPFIEGLSLLVIIGVITALLSLVGQFMAWAGMPNLSAMKDIILAEYQKAPWWSFMQGNTEALTQFQRWWDIGWQVFPNLFGGPTPGRPQRTSWCGRSAWCSVGWSTACWRTWFARLLRVAAPWARR